MRLVWRISCSTGTARVTAAALQLFTCCAVLTVEQKTVSAMVWMHQPYSKTRPEYERPRLPVAHWSVHDLRRTGRTQLAMLGCSEEVAEAELKNQEAASMALNTRRSNPTCGLAMFHTPQPCAG